MDEDDGARQLQEQVGKTGQLSELGTGTGQGTGLTGSQSRANRRKTNLTCCRATCQGTDGMAGAASPGMRTTTPPAPADGAQHRDRVGGPAGRPAVRRGRKHAASGIAGGTAGHVGCGCVAGARAVWRMVTAIGAEGREPGRGAA